MALTSKCLDRGLSASYGGIGGVADEEDYICTSGGSVVVEQCLLALRSASVWGLEGQYRVIQRPQPMPRVPPVNKAVFPLSPKREAR
jgi:hypothetical protein